MYTYTKFLINRCILNGIVGYFPSLFSIYHNDEQETFQFPVLILFFSGATSWFALGITMHRMLKKNFCALQKAFITKFEVKPMYEMVHNIFLYLIVFGWVLFHMQWQYTGVTVAIIYIIYFLWFIKEIRKVWSWLRS